MRSWFERLKISPLNVLFLGQRFYYMSQEVYSEGFLLIEILWMGQGKGHCLLFAHSFQ